MDMKKLRRVITAALLSILLNVSGSVCEAADKTSSERYLDAIVKYVENGQYNLAEEAAKNWAAVPDPDLALMSEACAVLSNKKLHEAAVVLLERLDWIMPLKSHWPDNTLYYMKQRGLNKEVDKVLTYGTALTAREDTRQRPPARWRLGYKTNVHPQSATSLFRFYDTDTKKLGQLFDGYESELKKRPRDVGLITEYAYWLAENKRIDKALTVVSQIDLMKLDLLTLLDMGNMWDPLYHDVKLVRFTIDPLERALELEMTDKEAGLYTQGWQVMVSTSLAKRLFRENLLMDLGKRYVRLERYHDAKLTYEKYLELPRRERWGDRTRAQKEYGNVLKKLGLHDKNRMELESKAKKSGKGKDWAELAAYLQGQNEIVAAKKAWERAIASTPPTPRGFKTERPKEQYRGQLIKMLDDNKMYKEEIRVLKDALKEEISDYEKRTLLESIAKAYLKWGKKDEAIKLLFQQLNESFDIEVVHLIIRTDHEKSLFKRYHVSHYQTEKLPSWKLVLKRINGLKEPEKSEALANFYSTYDMYAEYVDLVEQLPEEQIDWLKMDTLMDHAFRCGRYERTVYWGIKALEHTGEKGFPQEGSRDYINTLEDISDYAAKASDFATSLEYAKKLCLLVPERFYFVESLAKIALEQGKQDELVDELRAFAKQHPNRWVVWKVLADVYGVFGEKAKSETCRQKAARLK